MPTHMSATVINSVIFRNIFSTEAMRGVFSDQNRIQKYLDFEAALARAQARLGIIPQNAADEIVRHCRAAELDFEKLEAETARIGYPVLPVVAQIVALCRDGLGEWCHWGATTQDVTDTATVLQIREALTLIEGEIDRISAALAALARKYRDTPMASRSNLQQAVPITFGYKMAALLAGFERHRQRLTQLKERVLVGEFGGAAGTLASLGDRGLEVQAELMKELQLGAPAIAWHTMRDTIAETGCFLGLVTGTCGKFALDVKLLMQTEVEEVFEPFHSGRGSSSTMPQKRNPISSVYIPALNSVVRQQVAALLDAMVEDYERATGPWEIEWIVLPEIFLPDRRCVGAHPDRARRFASRREQDARQPRRDPWLDCLRGGDDGGRPVSGTPARARPGLRYLPGGHRHRAAAVRFAGRKRRNLGPPGPGRPGEVVRPGQLPWTGRCHGRPGTTDAREIRLTRRYFICLSRWKPRHFNER